jgi:membrane-bound lytic murein transglycosylase A
MQALENNLSYLKRTKTEKFALGDRTVSREQLLSTNEAILNAARNSSTGSLNLSQLTDIGITSLKLPERVLFTGYYEARLNGSRTPSARFNYPLYKRPADLIAVDFAAFEMKVSLPRALWGRLAGNKLVPYYSRQEIDYQGALGGKDLELVWVDDPIEAFFLHIQGSGVVTFEDGSTMRVGYAGKNGHPYKAIGRYLIDKGILTRESATRESIIAHLRANPKDVQEVLQYNPSYIFFQDNSEQLGAIGSTGVALTELRSIAADPAVYPPGAIAFIELPHPFEPNQSISRLVVVQDTGGAIKGAQRVDLFTGFGEQAEKMAGELKHRGTLAILLKSEE